MKRVWSVMAGLLLLFSTARTAIKGADIEVLTPQPDAVVAGETFELAWRCDPNVVGTAVAICINNRVIANYNQNAAENHLTLAVPMILAGTRCQLAIYSYWEASSTDPNSFLSPHAGIAWISFADSIDFLEVAATTDQNQRNIVVGWRGHPEYTGSALRVELWQGPDPQKLVRVLGYAWDYTTTAGSFSCATPRNLDGGNYKVRLVSLYQEAHGAGNTKRYAMQYTDSGYFALNSTWYGTMLSPTAGTVWREDWMYHVLWQWDPVYYGTAARIELWRNGRFLMVLGNKWNCGSENDFVVFCPPMEYAADYQVRAISYWLESQPPGAISAALGGRNFVINGQPIGQVTFPNPGSVWQRESDGKFRLEYNSRPELVGTAVRIDLWKGTKFYKTLGYNWNNQNTNVLRLDDPRVPADKDYYLRVVSYWQEQHPRAQTPTFFESTGPMQIGSELPFRLLHVSDQYNGDALWLQLGWHAEWPFVGTAFRLELWPVRPRVADEHYVIEYPQSSGDDTYRTYLIPPLPTDETMYYVRLSSYWQEQIQGPYQYLQTPWWIEVPNPRQK